jgi:hypothetical protein
VIRPPVLALAFLLGLFALEARAGDQFQVRVFPQVSMPGADLTVTVENVGPVTEAVYCLGLEVRWAEGNTTKVSQDCPAWDVYAKAMETADRCDVGVIVCPEGYDCYLPSCRAAAEVVASVQRRWTFSTRRQRVGYGPGAQQLWVRFFLPNGKTRDRQAPFFVGGE